jgi:tellurite resistance protein
MTPLEVAAARYRAAVQDRDEARDLLRAAVLAAIAGGMSEAEAARVAGVTRMTVRAWRVDK